MALRRGASVSIKNWLGLQTFASETNIGPSWFKDSNNVIVTNDGSAACLRSPATFNTALSTSTEVLSAFDYENQSGNLILFDIEDTTYKTTGTSNTLVRSGQTGNRWQRLNINNWAYSIDGTEFVQTDGTDTYDVGLDGPVAAPTISYVAGGSGSLAVGVSASYAYRNSNTGDVSQPSPPSNTLGATAGLRNVRLPVVVNPTSGDQIIVFLTVDGGSIRYLVVDVNGDPQLFPNATANLDLSIASIYWDQLTPETSFNEKPPATPTFLFTYKNRLLFCDSSAIVRYSAFESVYYGTPWACFPSLNGISLPNKSDRARGGIETPIGALVLGEKDSYLIRGTLTDKVSAPQGNITITESIQAMKWSIGTRSPLTIKETPFGDIWLDQNKRLQLWTMDGPPTEIGLPIRDLLGTILDTDSARSSIEGVWYQHGKDGGIYILNAQSPTNQLFFVTVYRDPESNDLRFACGYSDLPAQCLLVASVAGRKRLFFGGTDALFEFMDLDLQGAGWASGDERFFSIVLGNDAEFLYWHSLRFDASDITGLEITIANLDGTESQVLELVQETGNGSAWFGTLDSYGFRKTLTFTFSANDTAKRIINNLRVAVAGKRRLI